MLGRYGVPHAEVNGTEKEGDKTETGMDMGSETVTEIGRLAGTERDWEQRKGRQARAGRAAEYGDKNDSVG